MNWVYTICFLYIPVLIFSAEKKSLYNDYRKLYSNLLENDKRAFGVLNISISKAKQVRDYNHLVFAYEDAAYYSPKPQDKLKYADSALNASLKSENNSLISRSYLGKGIVFYFNFKNYSQALSQYLLANKWAENSQDQYLKFKIKYHLGAVKNYLGYYEESIVLFRDCENYFEHRLKEKLHPDEEYNNTRGILNSLHQLIIANLYTNNNKNAQALVKKGFRIIKDRSDYNQELGYFLKCAAIIHFRNRNYSVAENYFIRSIELLKHKNDFASIAVAHYYLGKIYIERNSVENGLYFFKKVDSSFTVNNFMIPEVRSTYQYQIHYAKVQGDQKSEIYNMNQLLKVDKILATDFPYLSTRIHREYDNANLIKDKTILQKSNSLKTLLLSVVGLLSLAVISLLVGKNLKQRRINRNYKSILDNLKNNRQYNSQENLKRKNVYDEKIVDEILIKLGAFEKGTKFLEKGLNLVKMADYLKTNSTHLSYVINDSKKINFNTYIKSLRINYITKLMYSDSKYLNYTVESLAKECGISSRQVFSDQFYEINGLRPTDFIRKRLEELKSIKNADTDDEKM